MTTLITLITFVIIGSAFFSGLEAALFAINQSKVEVLKEQKKRGAESLHKIKEKMSRPIAVIVIGNNIVNIVGSIYVGVVAADVFGNKAIGLISALLTFLIIIFGEILPKTIGENNNEKISLMFAPLLLWATRILLPLVWIIEKLTNRFVTAKNIVSEEEIQMMSHLGTIEGSIEDDEREMIENVFTLNDISAHEIMTPRTVVVAFEGESKIGDIEDDIYDLSYSRIPVYEENIDNITGIVYRKDLLVSLAKDEKDVKVKDFVQEGVFVSEDIKADDLIPMFQRRKAHLAIVKNEFGGTSGIVTLEDVLEELVGEIVDEEDEIVDTRAHARKNNDHIDIEE
jgi:CBS domain containing-hemolysin-like protein